jgi:hypothetical protein
MTKWNRPFHIYLAALSVMGGFIVYLATSRMGPGVSTDSAMILATAENLARGHGLIDYRGAELTQFPPLYSMILAFGSLISGQDVFVVGWALNILVFSALVWFGGLYFFYAFRDEPILAYLASFIVFSSASLIQISSNVASDPLFMLIVIFFLMSCSAYLAGGRTRYLVWAAVLTIVGSFQRYAGLSLAITGTLIVAYKNRTNIRMAGWLAGLFAVVTAGPICLWGYLHNYPVNGTVFGGRLEAVPVLNFLTGAEKLLYWFLPYGVIASVGVLKLLAIIGCGCVIAMFNGNVRRFLRQIGWPPLAPNIAFLLVYFAVLIFDISYYELKGLKTDRVHIIALPSLLILVFSLGGGTLQVLRRKFGTSRVYSAALVVFLMWSIYPITKTAEYVRSSMASGDVSSYNSINKGDIRDSGLARYLKSLDLHDKKIYSNGADSTWFILRTRVDALPVINSRDRQADLQQHYAKWPGAGNDGYIIWINSEPYRAYLATPAELDSIAQVHQVYDAGYATVYYVTSR